MDHLRKHWRGELPLVTSFWVNVFLLNLFFRGLEVWLDKGSPIEHPVTAAQVSISFFVITVLIIYPWQIVGVWRSAIRYSAQPSSDIWGGAVRTLVVLGVLGTLGNLTNSLPVYKDLFNVGFGKDQFADYQVTLTDDRMLAHLKGGLGFGVSKEVSRLLAQNPEVTGIILDSRGGWIYEGRRLSEIILGGRLDTYSLIGCYSACGTAFVAGDRRYLAQGANLAFHQYRAAGENVGMYADMGSEQQEDLLLYQFKGISEEFMTRIFSATQDDLWYPTIDEMLLAGMVHEVIDPSDIRRNDIGDFAVEDVEREIDQYSAFKSIKAYEPEIYTQIVESIVDILRKGGSRVETQQIVAGYIDTLATRSLPLTSNRALITYIEAIVAVLDQLEIIDPILCVKNLYPDQYGAVDVMQHLSVEEMMPLMDAISLVIDDKYETNAPEIDIASAEQLMTDIGAKIGDDIYYLDSPKLENNVQYSMACRTIIRYYELILAHDADTAANGLRYAFSQ